MSTRPSPCPFLATTPPLPRHYSSPTSPSLLGARRRPPVFPRRHHSSAPVAPLSRARRRPPTCPPPPPTCPPPASHVPRRPGPGTAPAACIRPAMMSPMASDHSTAPASPGLTSQVATLTGLRVPSWPTSTPGSCWGRTPPPSMPPSPGWSAWWRRPRPCWPPGSPPRATGRPRATAPRPGCWPPWRGSQRGGPAHPGDRPAPGRAARVRGGPALGHPVGAQAHRDHPRPPRRPRRRGGPVGRIRPRAPARGQGALPAGCGPPPRAGTRWPPAGGSTPSALHLVDRRRGGVLLPGPGHRRAGGGPAGPAGPRGPPPAGRPGGRQPPARGDPVRSRAPARPRARGRPAGRRLFALLTGATPHRSPAARLRRPRTRPAPARPAPARIRRPARHSGPARRPDPPASGRADDLVTAGPRPPSSSGWTWPPCAGAGPSPAS